MELFCCDCKEFFVPSLYLNFLQSEWWVSLAKRKYLSLEVYSCSGLTIREALILASSLFSTLIDIGKDTSMVTVLFPCSQSIPEYPKQIRSQISRVTSSSRFMLIFYIRSSRDISLFSLWLSFTMQTLIVASSFWIRLGNFKATYRVIA